MAYDLLIKGGHVLDPGQGIDQPLDIAIADGLIVAMKDEIPVADAKKLLEVRGSDRYVVPGLIDLHTHVAHGATTPGVGMACCDPDRIGIQSGVTTVVDCGSVGVANMGVFPAHILPKSRTRIECYVNIASYAHTMPNPADLNSLDEVNREAISRCIASNPGLISGLKLRLVGAIVNELGEDLVTLALEVAREHDLPLMVHIGDSRARDRHNPERVSDLTRFLLKSMSPGDILTHLCTPNIGGVMDTSRRPVPEVAEARANGVVLDSALGLSHFDFGLARAQAQLGMFPDTISSDLTGMGESFHSLMECMAKFMAVEYSLSDVVRMTTHNAAKALSKEDSLGALAVGRVADITIMDVVEGEYQFLDTAKNVFTGNYGLAPVQTVRNGELIAPHWGTHPWGWLPASIAGGEL